LARHCEAIFLIHGIAASPHCLQAAGLLAMTN